MPRFGVRMQRTASATLDVGSVITAAASVRRFHVYDMMFGSEAAPADNPYLWEVNRRTGLATGGSAPTITPLDFTDTAAATVVANQAPSSNGAGSGLILSVPLNQRATFRWVAAPGGELISSIAASNGYAIATPTSTALAVTATYHVLEY
jgi:hypothetical protein